MTNWTNQAHGHLWTAVWAAIGGIHYACAVSGTPRSLLEVSFNYGALVSNAVDAFRYHSERDKIDAAKPHAYDATVVS